MFRLFVVAALGVFAVCQAGAAAPDVADLPSQFNTGNFTPGAMEKDAQAIYNKISSVLFGVGIGLGFALALVGYRYKRTSLFTCAFCVSGGFAYVAVDTMTQGHAAQAWAPAVSLVVVGLVVGGLAAWLIKLGVFAAGAGTGVIVAVLLQTAVLHRLPVTPNLLMYIAMGVFGLALGLLALRLERPLLILATALGGSFLFMYGIGHFASGLPSPFSVGQYIEGQPTVESVPTVWWVYLGAIVAATLLSCLLQHKVTAPKKRNAGAVQLAGADTYLVLEGGMRPAASNSLSYGGKGGTVILETTEHRPVYA